MDVLLLSPCADPHAGCCGVGYWLTEKAYLIFARSTFAILRPNASILSAPSVPPEWHCSAFICMLVQMYCTILFGARHANYQY